MSKKLPFAFVIATAQPVHRSLSLLFYHPVCSIPESLKSF